MLNPIMINPRRISVTDQAEKKIKEIPYSFDLHAVSDDQAVPFASYVSSAFWQLPDGTRHETGPYYSISVWTVGKIRAFANLFIVAFGDKALAVCPAPDFSPTLRYTLDFDGNHFSLTRDDLRG